MGFKLRREAKEWEHEFLEHMQGTPDMTFQALHDHYIEDISHRLRQNSVNGKKNIFKNRILPYFKDKPINQITSADIRKWQNDQIALGYSAAYLDRIQNTLTTIFNFAVTYYNLPNNPCTKAGHMGKRTKSMKFWTLEQYKTILSFEDDPTVRTALQTLFYSGMRFGELLALELKDFDFLDNTINISKSLQYDHGTIVITPPKTDNGVRVVPMPATVMKEIKDYINMLYGINDNNRIFTFTKSLIRNHMKKCSEKSNQPFIRIHDLRHSHVSLLVEMGFSPYLIADRIGDTPQMVMNTYGHLYPNKQIEVADKLNLLIN